LPLAASSRRWTRRKRSCALPDEHYINSELAELYDLDSPWSADRDFYLSQAGQPPQTILDFGCGTGLICNAYAELGHDVTGVDPAPAMLAIARRKPFGAKIEWVEATAQTFRSDKRFDLMIMTGHVFQILLEDEDVRAAFETMRMHLKPGGKAVFESRNRAIDWAAEWGGEVVLEARAGRIVETHNVHEMLNDRLKFDSVFRFPDKTLTSKSELRFMSLMEIEAHLKAAELRVENLIGDWDGAPFDPAVSKEMIFTVRAV
jgi:2-polyprenyl-3-methyl-5-hydroxy-6-metoxy-1,4-benzoquinol methylase